MPPVIRFRLWFNQSWPEYAMNTTANRMKEDRAIIARAKQENIFITMSPCQLIAQLTYCHGYDLIDIGDDKFLGEGGINNHGIT